MNLKYRCDKHGNITNSAFTINYIDNNGKIPIAKKKTYCLECIADFLDKINMPKITEVIED
jgi:hypothetical protein